MSELTTRETHRIIATKRAISLVLLDQQRHASAQSDEGAILAGALSACFDHLVRTLEMQGCTSHEAVLKAKLWWRAIPDSFGMAYPIIPGRPMNDR